jgi:hypothetical protein
MWFEPIWVQIPPDLTWGLNLVEIYTGTGLNP